MSGVYYNEWEPYPAQWLRNLIAAGHLPGGDVDERSITDVSPDDLRGYDQCHFFAGIGGWPLALRWAGWPDDRPVWTGSCPCQPFSPPGAVHNKARGYSDSRDLWPVFGALIRQCQPDVVFGEQVTAAIRYGWYDRLCCDMEKSDYTGWAAILPAVCTAASHKRCRLFFALHSVRGGGARSSPSIKAGGFRQEWAYRPADLLSIAGSPFEPGERYPQPIVRLDHDGLPASVVKSRTKGAGNAIVPQVAAEFIQAYLEMKEAA